VRILYDIDTPVLQYGIIRNVFPPLIENYFVHAFDTVRDDNFIIFRGRVESEKILLISLEDNGQGMAKGHLAALNDSFREKVTMEYDSYGLKNLHQRLRLFYGDQYGIMVRSNEDRGLSVEIRIAKMTCEEYYNSHYEKERVTILPRFE
jgi:sensor histidine kinase YesM